ncbi:MAG: HepT-like ribonuclease domain-containing protein [Litorimonas sp.]
MRTRLVDMRDYAVKAIDLLGNLSPEAFASDDRTFYAVIKCVEVVGEAAAQIGRSDLQSLSSDIPWRDVIGMRNILVHEYSGISPETIFDTVTLDFPVLIQALEKLLET